MNLCSICLQKAGLVVKYVNMLRIVKFCDGCKQKNMIVDVEEVAKQILVTEG